ncbi:CRAL/TRIO domain-containing protein [Poronia punctata]|nr:CRAL/TRIO domain-containing protein [Poronia punctata]
MGTTNGLDVKESEIFLSGLTDEEKQCFEDLLEQCREDGLLAHPEGLSAEDAVDGLADEATLLRFLRGRSFDVAGSFNQFKEARAMRDTFDANAAYDRIDIAEFERLRGVYPSWSGQRTKRGLPICLFDPVRLDDSVIAHYKKASTLPDTMSRAMVTFDYLPRFVIPLCSAITDRPDPETPITNLVYLADIDSISLRQGWNIRSFAQHISGLLSTCYPEVVDTIYVLNAPSYFARLWSFLKGWIEPRTAEKLVFVSPEEMLDTLLETMDAESIPVKFGGKSKAMHGLPPCLDEAAKKLLGRDELPAGPVKWVTDSQGKRTAVAVGTKDGEARNEVVCSIDAKA